MPHPTLEHASLLLGGALVLSACFACRSSAPSPHGEPASGAEPLAATAVRGSATPVTQPVHDGVDDQTLDWSAVDPLAFLDLLRGRADGGLFTVWTPPPAGWIDAAALPRLVGLLRSEEPACGVVSSRSSFLPLVPAEGGGTRVATSTVGREAAFLLAGHRAGHYPPTLSSLSYFEPDPDALERWWHARDRGH